MRMSFVKMFCRSSVLGAMALLIPFTVPVSLSAQATDDWESITALRVKFLGGDNDALFFTVKYANKDGSNFKLLVLDETGEALFEDNYSKEIDKKLKVPRLTDSDHVTFLVKSSTDAAELSYKVRVTTKVVDDALVVKN